MSRLHTKKLTLCAGRKKICHELSLTMQSQEIWGILGANGSGKTTLLHSLAGLIPAKSGEIWLNDHKLSALSIRAIAKSIGILLQDFTEKFNQSVQDYCLAGRFPHRTFFNTDKQFDYQIVSHALKTLELEHLATQSIMHLSGGEKRRVAIATLLTQAPKIYLLDEPTNHLDLRHQMRVLQHFHQLAKTSNVSVIMSLHDINLVQQFCDHVLFLLPDGNYMHGTTHELLTAEHLTMLYQHPIQSFKNGKHIVWYSSVV